MFRFRFSALPASAVAFAFVLCTVDAAVAHTRITTDVTWSGDIRNLLAKRCMTCHRPGGIAPDYVDLTVYGTDTKPGARAWAVAIEEMVLTNQMPPWQADPRFSNFSNSHDLSQEEEDLLIAWIRGGAPQGPDRNLPPPDGVLDPGWTLAEPDFVVDLVKPFTLTADTPYTTHIAVKSLELSEDTYLTAYEFMPGNPAVVKSMSAWIHDPPNFDPQPIEVEVILPYDPLADEDDLETTRMRPMPKGPHFLGVWFRGDGPMLFPVAAGRLVRAGSTVELIIEYERPDYVANADVVDDSKLGLFFAGVDEEIDLLVESVLVHNSKFNIPANAVDHAVSAEHVFIEDVHIVNIATRMNRLGSKLEARLVYPDGLERILLYLPDFDWKWNANYTFEEPVAAPAGSRLVLTGWYDNSEDNWDNPNSPPAIVKSGEERYDEVLLAMADYTLDNHLYVQPEFVPDLTLDDPEADRGGMSIVPTLPVPDEQPNAPLLQLTSAVAAAANSGPAADIYWCPMRGNPCEIADFNEPGTCPECFMDLKPKSSFFEDVETAPQSADWVLTPAGADQKYWCLNRGAADHELIDYPEPGVCPVDGEPLVHAARFKLVRTFTCLTPSCGKFKELFFGPGLCPSCGQPVTGMGHMDHNPLHGGWQFFMADNLYHHLEGTMPEPGRFVLYFYDDWKTPLDARNFSGKVFVLNENPDTGEVTETEYPLYVDREGDEFLVADLPKELPINFYAKVWLAGEQKRYDFGFDELTVVEDIRPVDLRLHAHDCPPIQVPPDLPGKVRYVLEREATLKNLIDQEQWFDLHCPAYEAKAVVDIIAIEPNLGLNVRQAGQLKKTVAQINRAALALDRAGDAADAARVKRAFETFAEGVSNLSDIFPAPR